MSTPASAARATEIPSAEAVRNLTALLREAEEHHGEYEPTAPKHHWSNWYAAYIVARERGKTPEEAAKDGALQVTGAPG